MLRAFTLFFVASILVGKSCAQKNNSDEATTLDSHYPKIRLELLLGPSFVYARQPNSLQDFRVEKFGFAGNLGSVHQFNSRFGVDIKLRYENKGLKTISYSLLQDFNPPATEKFMQDITYNYFTLSILGRYSILKIRNLYFGTGPYLGYLLSTRGKQELYINGNLIQRSGSRPDPYLANKKFDVGVSTLVGYNMHIKQTRTATVQFVHNFGLVDVNQPMIGRIRNNTYSLLFGLSLNKKNWLNP